MQKETRFTARDLHTQPRVDFERKRKLFKLKMLTTFFVWRIRDKKKRQWMR
jgi:hypothetical protein